MRKVFIYTIISLLLFTPAAYSGFWYFSAWKTKNLLTEAISYINDEKFDISYDFSGFPFSLIFHVTNPKFSNEQLTISSKALLVKNRLFDKSVYIYIPSNAVDITARNDEKKSIKCHTNDSNHLVVKLNDLLPSLRFGGNSTIIDYINMLRYEDYGLKCVLPNLEGQKSVATEVNGKSNYIQFDVNKELNGNIKLGFGFYAYRIANPESYLSIDTKFDCEFMNDISASSINFNIEKFAIQNNNFSLAADGRVQNYNLVTSSFTDKINVAISNYKELISFAISDEFSKNHSNAFEKLILSLSEKTTGDSIQFSIKYDNDVGSSFIGKLSATDFVNQLSKINQG